MVPLARMTLEAAERKVTRYMIKTLDLITEVVSNTKNTFRKVVDRPRNAENHRYERRKVKEYLKIGDWAEQGAV